MTDETRIEIDKCFDRIMSLLNAEPDETARALYEDVRECGIRVCEVLDEIQD